ncbi:MAG: ABC-type transporter, permease subunit, partial [Chlamydiia bacterium]|nr:ABC-type transporter, permease subunit [Chlamydiia bacterium]
MTYINPYYDNNFFEFFLTLASRVGAFFSGDSLTLASDELQILVLSLIALTSSCVGTFLILRKMTMLANALSHTILVGIVGAYLFTRAMGEGGDHFDFSHLLPNSSVLVIACLMTAFLTTFLTELLITKVHLSEETSCGIVFTFLF